MENVDVRMHDERVHRHDASGRLQFNVKPYLLIASTAQTIYRLNSIFHRHMEFSRLKKKKKQREESTKLLINTSFACSSCFTSIRKRHVNC